MPTPEGAQEKLRLERSEAPFFIGPDTRLIRP
jgi:hypothetical protein